jgi:hypothetical protein
MATNHDRITESQAELLQSAPMFFVASADPTLSVGPGGIGPVNVSPKGGVKLHVLSPQRVAYLDYRGSGNETARHAAASGPVTLMTCSFDASDAAIVRLYGRATIVPLEDHPHASRFVSEGTAERLTPRQVVEIEVDATMTSCGYGVPVMELVAQRRPEARGRRFKPTP